MFEILLSAIAMIAGSFGLGWELSRRWHTTGYTPIDANRVFEDLDLGTTEIDPGLCNQESTKLSVSSMYFDGDPGKASWDHHLR